MKSKITYLLGAGASAGGNFSGNSEVRINKLPTVEKFVKEIDKIEHKARVGLIENVVEIDSQTKTTTKDVEQILSLQCRELSRILKSFSSIDTYARYLFLRGLPEFHKLKAFINFCFRYWQVMYGLDTRYDSFFSFLLSNTVKRLSLPANVNIISWNYDLQLESCLARYAGGYDFNKLDSWVRIIPTPNLDAQNPPSAFRVVKLNGSSGVFLQEGKILKRPLPLRIYSDALSEEEIQSRNKEIELILQEYFHSQNGFQHWDPFITWSWEQTEQSKSVLKEALELCNGTDILVIIGYSFPLINWQVDQQLFSKMNQLKRIYIQSPAATINQVRERCIALLDSNIHTNLFDSGLIVDEKIVNREAIDEFHVPHEIFVKGTTSN